MLLALVIYAGLAEAQFSKFGKHPIPEDTIGSAHDNGDDDDDDGDLLELDVVADAGALDAILGTNFADQGPFYIPGKSFPQRLVNT